MQPIGIIHTPWKALTEMPIQSIGAQDTVGSIIIKEKFIEGLKDLAGFSHIILIYTLHQSKAYKLTVKPFLSEVPKGVFSTRAPSRPNPIGLSIVELQSVQHNILHIKGADMLNGTPLLDIKPYVKAFDCFEDAKSGWLENEMEKANTHKSDDRFLSR